MTTQPPSTTVAPADEPVARPHWAALSLVCFAYLAATVGEQVLSPVFPTAADDLGLSESAGGIAFGTLAASIALANLAGGALLRRHGVARMLTFAAIASTLGSTLAALAPGFALLVAAQVFLGIGAGFFFPAGLQAVALVAGPSRKGFAMGIYGVAFSGGLTLAALLGTLGASQGWRSAFWVSAALSAAAVIVSPTLRVHATVSGPSRRVPLRVILGLPTAVGSVGAICQYGAIPFLTTFAVAEWGLSEAGAAGVLAAGRVISIVAKLVSGAGADRVGPRASARSTGLVLVVTGLAWVLLPGGW
ncbi:MAG TPA: MFS transporter, partial [Acidimicrobiales bacterium]